MDGQQGRTPPLDPSTVPESVIDRIGSVDNPMSVRRASGTLAEDGGDFDGQH
jgi:hypothetical protein